MVKKSKPYYGKLGREIDEFHLEEAVKKILRAAKFRIEEEARTSGMGDILASHVHLGREQRYALQVTTDLTPAKANEHVAHFRQYVRQSKQPFSDFNEFWLIADELTDEERRVANARDRHFRIMDIKDLSRFLSVRKPPRRASSKIGRAVLANQNEIALAVASLTLQIEEKLDILRRELPNSPEAISSRDSAISDCERMQAELENIRVLIAQFKKNEVKEAEVVKSVATFSDGVRGWWNKSHVRICDSTYTMGMFATAVTICSLAGASGNVGVALSAALVGGKPVADVVKGLAKKFLPS